GTPRRPLAARGPAPTAWGPLPPGSGRTPSPGPPPLGGAAPAPYRPPPISPPGPRPRSRGGEPRALSEAPVSAPSRSPAAPSSSRPGELLLVLLGREEGRERQGQRLFEEALPAHQPPGEVADRALVRVDVGPPHLFDHQIAQHSSRANRPPVPVREPELARRGGGKDAVLAAEDGHPVQEITGLALELDAALKAHAEMPSGGRRSPGAVNGPLPHLLSHGHLADGGGQRDGHRQDLDPVESPGEDGAHRLHLGRVGRTDGYLQHRFVPALHRRLQAHDTPCYSRIETSSRSIRWMQRESLAARISSWRAACRTCRSTSMARRKAKTTSPSSAPLTRTTSPKGSPLLHRYAASARWSLKSVWEKPRYTRSILAKNSTVRLTSPVSKTRWRRRSSPLRGS